MKSRTIRFTLLALVVALVSQATASTAHAQSADVRKDYNCFLRVPSMRLFLQSSDSHFVRNKNTMSATCHFQIPDNMPKPDKAVKIDNIRCRFFGVFTRDCTAIITPSGKVTLKAKAKLSGQMMQ